MGTLLLFGGYRASKSDMISWQSSAQKQRPDLTIKCIPWRGGRTAGNPLQPSTDWLEEIAKKTDPTAIIAGHSSGCALANFVAELLPNSKLVALDGFKPKGSLQERALCWSAQDGDVRSRNFSALQSAKHFHVYQATNCKNPWALHFSLVNSAASDAIVSSIKTGYSNCRANLVWLETIENAVIA
jgi:hypothetical protein